jgi:hypothetical protein
VSTNGNGQSGPVFVTTTRTAVAALAVRAVTRGDTHARHDIERLYPQFDYEQLAMTVEIATQLLGELVNLRTLHRVYYEEPAQ